MKLKLYTGEELRALREKLGLNQTDFWARFKVTQSGGSRYESGREIPNPIQILLNLAFGSETKARGLFEELWKFGHPKAK
ncbi:helix-turn-helix domain-containing protein [Thauera sp. WH-1]|jgi:transcriptional regulator with XRE-family HTH domain|uniref:helix-turn-helix domain-containing protein n=1 Tax=Thauera sp. WH-1 TaxID=3398230 RepID=UPI0039FC1B44